MLGDPYLTAVIMDDIILYWPCKRLDKWYPRPNLTACYADLPIQFHNDVEWVDGYMNTRTGDVTLASQEVVCNTSIHWFKQGASYYKMQGSHISAVSLVTDHRLPVRVNNTVLRNI